MTERLVHIIEADNALLALRIFTMMHYKPLSIYALAKAAGLRVSTVQRICAGAAEHPSLWTIAAIATVLETSIDSLTYGEQRHDNKLLALLDRV